MSVNKCIRLFLAIKIKPIFLSFRVIKLFSKRPVQAQSTLLCHITAPLCLTPAQPCPSCQTTGNATKSRQTQTDPSNRIKENSVCLYVAACTKQTHAAPQSTYL